MVFAFTSHDPYSDACGGRLLGMTNTVADACRPDPRGLGADGYVVMGSETCQSCMIIEDMCSSTDRDAGIAALEAVLRRLLPPSLLPWQGAGRRLAEKIWDRHYGC